MRTIHQSRTLISLFAAVLACTLCTPIAVDADEQDIAEEQVLTAEDQIPDLVPADPTWDETSGYHSVETARAAISGLVAAPTIIESQVPADVRWAPPRTLVAGASVAAASACPGYLPAALVSGRRAETAHLATVPLLGADGVPEELVNC
jgi:hypothetical protein